MRHPDTVNDMASTLSPVDELFGPDQLAALTRAASARPVVLLLETENALAELVVPLLASTLLPTAASRAADLRLVAPESTNWSVDEVSSQILGPASLSPNVRNLIVVFDAHKMSSACADHLLKAIEEPLAPTTFVLVTPDAELLLATIRGRVGQSVSLGVAPDALARHLESLGLSPDVASTALEAFSTRAALLTSLAASPTHLAELIALAASLPAPAKAATTALAASSLLGEICAGTKEEGDEQSTPATAAKKRARALAQLVISAWRQHVTRTLATRPELASRAAGRLLGFDQAEQILERNGSVELALALALVGR